MRIYLLLYGVHPNRDEFVGDIMCYNHVQCNAAPDYLLQCVKMQQENQMRLLLLSAALRLASISAAFASASAFLLA